MSTKAELEAENEMLRGKLEEIYDMIGEVLGFDDTGENEDIELDADAE